MTPFERIFEVATNKIFFNERWVFKKCKHLFTDNNSLIQYTKRKLRVNCKICTRKQQMESNIRRRKHITKYRREVVMGIKNLPLVDCNQLIDIIEDEFKITSKIELQSLFESISKYLKLED